MSNPLPSIKLFMESLKLVPGYAAAIALAVGMFLVLPDKSLEFFGLSDFNRDYRKFVSLTFLLSAALLLVIAIQQIAQWALRKQAAYLERKRIHQRLASLADEEKEILRRYIVNQSRSQSIGMDDGVAQCLEAEGILVRYDAFKGATIIGMNARIPYSIAETAWKHLNENRHLIGC